MVLWANGGRGAYDFYAKKNYHNQNLELGLHTCLDLSRFVETCSNMFRSVQTCSDLFWPVQTCSDLFRPVQNCSDLCANKHFSKKSQIVWLVFSTKLKIIGVIDKSNYHLHYAGLVYKNSTIIKKNHSLCI